MKLPFTDVAELSPEKMTGETFTFYPMALSIMGDNLPLTLSEPTLLMPFVWENWTDPKSSRLVHSPSRMENFLLKHRIVKREDPFMPSAGTEVEFRPLSIETRLPI